MREKPIQPVGHESKCPCGDCESWAVELLDWEHDRERWVSARIVDAVSAVGSALALLSMYCEQADPSTYEAVSDQIADAGLLSMSVEDSVLGFFRLAGQVERAI